MAKPRTVPLNLAAATLGRKGGRSKSPAKAAASRLNGLKGGRSMAAANLRQRVSDEYRDSDGYRIYLRPGWKNGSDPVGCVHTIVEATKHDAYSCLASALPCDCNSCLAELALLCVTIYLTYHAGAVKLPA